jgi:hypothetical protein
MKKLLLVAVVLILASCSKENSYECECFYRSNSVPGGATEFNVISADTEEEASDMCRAQSGSNGDRTNWCGLKQ